MTRYAQTHEIAFIVRTAMGDWLHMMHQGCRRSLAHTEALLAERMRRDVAVTHLSPATSVPLMLMVATGEMLVMPLHQASMFLAVACPAVGQVGATTIAAGAFWFRWHGLHLGKRKSPRGLMPSKARFDSTFTVPFYHVKIGIVVNFTALFHFFQEFYPRRRAPWNAGYEPSESQSPSHRQSHPRT